MAVVAVADEQALRADFLAEKLRHTAKEIAFKLHVVRRLHLKALRGRLVELLFAQARERRVRRHTRVPTPLSEHAGSDTAGDPGVELPRQIRRVTRRDVVPGAAGFVGLVAEEPVLHPRLDERIFIHKLNHRHRRLIAIGAAGQRIGVREQLPGIFALQLDEPLVEIGRALAEAKQFKITHAVAGLVGAIDIQVQVRVDAARFQFKNKTVQPLQRLRIQRARVRLLGDEQRPGGVQ